MTERVAFSRRALIVPLLVVAGIAALTLWSAFGGMAPRTAPQDEGARPVRFNMAWLPQGSMAGIFVAIDKGYFADAGLAVEPVRGFGGCGPRTNSIRACSNSPISTRCRLR